MDNDIKMIIMAWCIMLFCFIGYAYYVWNNPSFDYSVCNDLRNASSGTIEKCKGYLWAK